MRACPVARKAQQPLQYSQERRVFHQPLQACYEVMWDRRAHTLRGRIADKWWHAGGHLATVIATPAGAWTKLLRLQRAWLLLCSHKRLMHTARTSTARLGWFQKTSVRAAFYGTHCLWLALFGCGGTHHKMLQAACPRPQLTCVPLCVAPSLCAAAVCAGAPGLGAGRVHALPRRRGDLVHVAAAGQPRPPRRRQVRRRPLCEAS